MADTPHLPNSAPRPLKWAMLLGATAIVVYLCLLILTPFLNVIAWSAVLAITFHPVHEYLVRKTGHVSLSAFLASALVIVAFLIPLLFLTGLAVNQILALVASVQQTFDAGLERSTPWGGVYAWITRHLGMDSTMIAAWMRQHATELAGVGAEYTLAIAATVTSAAVSFVFIAFVMFLLFRDGDQIVQRIPTLLPFERARSEALLARIRDVVYGGVYGVVVIALLQGMLCGFMLWLLGVPSAALWGMVTALTSVLPLVGAAAVWVPASVYLALTGQWVQAIVLAAWGTAVVSGVDNFLRPKLVGGRVGLSELAMFFALLGGLRAFGILGIVLGPVVFAIAASIVDVVSNKAAMAEVVDGDP